MGVNPVPQGLLTRRAGGSRRSRTVPLVRVLRTLPRILLPREADRLAGALRTHRDRAMVLAMLLVGLRRCEVLGLRFRDVQVADRRLAVVEGKGGRRMSLDSDPCRRGGKVTGYPGLANRLSLILNCRLGRCLRVAVSEERRADAVTMGLASLVRTRRLRNGRLCCK